MTVTSSPTCFRCGEPISSERPGVRGVDLWAHIDCLLPPQPDVTELDGDDAEDAWARATRPGDL
jgi:hypothetical protein